MNRQDLQNEIKQARIAVTTVGNRREGEEIARKLVEARLAACVNIIGGVQSIYRWNDEVNESEEILLVIKTTEAKVSSVAAALQALHSYELPEFIVLPVTSGSEAYLAWIESSVR